MEEKSGVFLFKYPIEKIAHMPLILLFFHDLVLQGNIS